MAEGGKKVQRSWFEYGGVGSESFRIPLLTRRGVTKRLTKKKWKRDKPFWENHLAGDSPSINLNLPQRSLSGERRGSAEYEGRLKARVGLLRGKAFAEQGVLCFLEKTEEKSGMTGAAPEGPNRHFGLEAFAKQGSPEGVGKKKKEGSWKA